MENFIKHFVISGMVVGVSAVLIEKEEHELSGFLYGGLPIGFLYLLIVANKSRQKVIDFSRETYIGGIYFLFFTFLIYLLFSRTNLSISTCVVISTALFLLLIFATQGDIVDDIKNLL